VDRFIRIMIYVGIIILTIFYMAMTGVAIGSILVCNGLDANSIQFCRNYSGPVVLLNASFNTATDFWILFIPVPLVLKLNLPVKRKLGILGIFGAGLA
jgi:hypothetical protein